MYQYAEYEVKRDAARCVFCGRCVKECFNGVHAWRKTPAGRVLLADEQKCVNCHRCVEFCPTRALKIVRSDLSFKENSCWSGRTLQQIYKQANSGGVLLSSMGNPGEYPVYFDKILVNASQVTNPSIDPLREPMETRVSLGRRTGEIERDAAGHLIPKETPRTGAFHADSVFGHELRLHQL